MQPGVCAHVPPLTTLLKKWKSATADLPFPAPFANCEIKFNTLLAIRNPPEKSTR
jgi:hypothetical protein